MMFNGREYDLKAIAGVAHRYIAPGSEPLSAAEFSGGRETVKRTLERLGFVVSDSGRSSADARSLEVGRTYSWDELRGAFQFDPKLFQVGGGMLSRPHLNALLLITHPGGSVVGWTRVDLHRPRQKGRPTTRRTEPRRRGEPETAIRRGRSPFEAF